MSAQFGTDATPGGAEPVQEPGARVGAVRRERVDSIDHDLPAFLSDERGGFGPHLRLGRQVERHGLPRFPAGLQECAGPPRRRLAFLVPQLRPGAMLEKGTEHRVEDVP